jgi:ring-1,2-phenylacetyl-CoA epoxidase subunit PaaD
VVTAALDVDAVRALVEAVEDPELPHVTIGDLGMVRAVTVHGDRATVVLTPTYTGCPATEQIRADVADALARAGLGASISMTLTPPWTTDWITPAGRRKLATAGIAPPPAAGADHVATLDLPVACPRCGSRRTRRLSAFGATACKSPHVCDACREPFESFKAL